MVTIPRPAVQRSGRLARARSVSGGDVPLITPASDPGVQVPTLDEPGEALEQLGRAGQEAAGIAAEIDQRQKARAGAVDLADKSNTFNQDAAEKLRELNATADLSRDDVLREFGAFLVERQDQLLNEHTAHGTPDSLARLTIRLGEIADNFTTQAATLSAEIGRKKLTTQVDQDLAALVGIVNSDPARLDDALSRWNARVEDLAPGLNESDEMILRRHGPTVLSVTAINRILGAGDVEGADAMLRSAVREDLLDADTTVALTTRITDARLRGNELNFRLAQFEATVGRPANESERLALLGVPQPAGPTLNITIPQGFAPVTDAAGNLLRLEPIPGGPAALELEGAERAEVQKAETARRQQDIVVQDIGRAMNIIETAEMPVTGFTGSVLSVIGGTEAKNLSTILDTIKANVGFEKLQQMRNASPTGGALGQVSEMENRLLQSVLGSLEQSQSKEQLEFNLRRLNNTYLDIIHGVGAGPPRLPLTTGELPQVGTQAEVDALPSGTLFTWTPTGQTRRKN